MSQRTTNYKLGSLLSLTTAFLIATQEPFTSEAAKHLTFVQFVCLTQLSLIFFVPAMISRAAGRRDFVAILKDTGNYWKLAVLFACGVSGLLLYKVGLSNAHPIIISAVLNLSPFWAAAVALVISGKKVPVSPVIFFGCLAGAFIGAMAVAWSQIVGESRPSMDALADNFLHGTWIYAVPIPLLSALSGTLIGKWYSKFDESAAIAANFVASSLVLVPLGLIYLYVNSELHSDQYFAVALMAVGTIVSASIGRVLYQISLTVTDNDNGFVTMFFLLVPALTSLISLPLSWWIPDLRFVAGPLFFVGLIVIAAALLVFSLKTWRSPHHAIGLAGPDPRLPGD